MKKLYITFIICFVLILNIIFLVNAKAVNDNNGGSAGGYTPSGAGGYTPSYVGVKIVLYDSNYQRIYGAGGIVANQNVSASYCTNLNNKFDESCSLNSSNCYSSCNGISVNSSLPSSWDSILNSGSLYNELSKDANHDGLSYDLLNSLLDSVGASNLGNAQYIVVEPLLYYTKVKWNNPIEDCTTRTSYTNGDNCEYAGQDCTTTYKCRRTTTDTKTTNDTRVKQGYEGQGYTCTGTEKCSNYKYYCKSKNGRITRTAEGESARKTYESQGYTCTPNSCLSYVTQAPYTCKKSTLETKTGLSAHQAATYEDTGWSCSSTGTTCTKKYDCTTCTTSNYGAPTYYDSYFLTPYELINYFGDSSNEFQCATCSSKNPWTCTSLLKTFGQCSKSVTAAAQTIYINSNFSNKLSVYSNKDRSCVSDKNGGCAIGWYNYDDVVPRSSAIYSLNIHKQNEEGTGVPNVKFTLTGNGFSGSCTTNSSGNCSINRLEEGTYTLTESFASTGTYTLKSCSGCTVNSNGTMSVSISGNKSITVVNERGCGQRLSELTLNGRVPTKTELVSLYTAELSKGNNYTNLLNFSSPSCSVANCSYNALSSCLNASYIDNTFNENNWSCYNKKVEVDTNTGFCQTSFNLFPSTSYKANNIKSGQMYFKVTDGVVAEGTLNQTCFFAQTPSISSIKTGYIGDYLKNVSLGENLTLKENKELELNKSGSSFTGTVNFSYLFPEICVNNITGRPVTCGVNGSTSLGYGLLSKFTDNDVKKLNFNMKFDVDNNTLFKNNNPVNEITYNSVCSYTSTEEIVKNNKLQLEFRIIDTDNPFPGKTGTSRKVGSNWNGNETENSKTCTYTDYYIKNEQNSYGVISSTKTALDKPKYKIVLTSSDMSEIRKYNDTTTYDDYNFTCNDDTCTSNFLNGLKNGVVSYTNNEDKTKIDNSVSINTRLEVSNDYTKQNTCSGATTSEEIQLEKICKLQSGISKATGSQYTCKLDTNRTFYVLGDNEDSSKIDLIMNMNYTDDTVPATMAWCDPNGANPNNNACNHDNLNPLVSHIQEVFGNNVVVSIPSYNQIYKAAGNKSSGLPTWLYDNLDISLDPNGYWTSTPSDNGSIGAYLVCFYGNPRSPNIGLVSYAVYRADYSYGLRPVITISKTLMD
jgi:hypothetical protein